MTRLQTTLPELKKALKLTTPIILTYFCLAMVFGLLAEHIGLPWYLTTAFSALVYGGSVQFVSISIMADHGLFLTMLGASLFIALRNTFYGLNLLDRFGHNWWIKGLLAFGLVDANYALYVVHDPDENQNDFAFICYSTIIVYLSWIFGTLFGALFAKHLPKIPGLTFILPAFFLILVIENVLKRRCYLALLFPILSTVIAYYIAPTNFLLLAIVISVACLSLSIKTGLIK